MLKIGPPPSRSWHPAVPHPLARWVPTNPITSDTRRGATVLDPLPSICRSSCHPRGSLAPPSKSLKRGREPPSSTGPEPRHRHRVRGSASAVVFYWSRASPPPPREGIRDCCLLLSIRSQPAANAWGDVIILRSNRDTTGNLVDPSLDLCWCWTSSFSQRKQGISVCRFRVFANLGYIYSGCMLICLQIYSVSSPSSDEFGLAGCLQIKSVCSLGFNLTWYWCEPSWILAS
jgi:hypothetical protein